MSCMALLKELDKRPQNNFLENQKCPDTAEGTEPLDYNGHNFLLQSVAYKPFYSHVPAELFLFPCQLLKAISVAPSPCPCPPSHSRCLLEHLGSERQRNRKLSLVLALLWGQEEFCMEGSWQKMGGGQWQQPRVAGLSPCPSNSSSALCITGATATTSWAFTR